MVGQRKKKGAGKAKTDSQSPASGIMAPPPHKPVSYQHWDDYHPEASSGDDEDESNANLARARADGAAFTKELGLDMFMHPSQQDDCDESGTMEDSSRDACTPTLERVVPPTPKAGKRGATLSGMKQGFLKAAAPKAHKATERAAPDEDSADDEGPLPLMSDNDSDEEPTEVAHDVESHASESNDEPPELGDDDSDPPPLASDSDDEPPKVPPSDNKKEDFKSGFSFARPDLAAISKPTTEDPKAKANGAAKGSPAAPKEELAKPAAAEAKPQKENLAAQQAELMRDYPGLQDYEKPVERFKESVRLKAMSPEMAQKLRDTKPSPNLRPQEKPASKPKTPSKAPTPKPPQSAAAQPGAKKNAPPRSEASSSRAAVHQKVNEFSDDGEDDEASTPLPAPKAKPRAEKRTTPSNPQAKPVDKAEIAREEAKKRQEEIDKERLIKELIEAEEKEKHKKEEAKRIQEEEDQAKRDRRKQKAQRAKEAKASKAKAKASKVTGKAAASKPEESEKVIEHDESEASSSNYFDILDRHYKEAAASQSNTTSKSSKPTPSGESREQSGGAGPSNRAHPPPSATPITVAHARDAGGSEFLQSTPLPKPSGYAHAHLISKAQNTWGAMEEALHTKSPAQLTAALAQAGIWLHKQGHSKVFQAANTQLRQKVEEARLLLGPQPTQKAPPNNNPQPLARPAAARPPPPAAGAAVERPAPTPLRVVGVPPSAAGTATPARPYAPFQRPLHGFGAGLNPVQGGRAGPGGRGMGLFNRFQGPHPGMPPAAAFAGGAGTHWEQPLVASNDAFGGVLPAGVRPPPPLASYNPMQSGFVPPPPAPRPYSAGGRGMRHPIPAAVRAHPPAAFSQPARPETTDSMTQPSPFGTTVAPQAGGGGEEDDEFACCVCLDWPSDRIIQPCGHQCICQGCAEKVQADSGLCPLCRKTIEGFLVARD